MFYDCMSTIARGFSLISNFLKSGGIDNLPKLANKENKTRTTGRAIQSQTQSKKVYSLDIFHGSLSSRTAEGAFIIFCHGLILLSNCFFYIDNKNLFNKIQIETWQKNQWTVILIKLLSWAYHSEIQ